jgi:hypothetical protein
VLQKSVGAPLFLQAYAHVRGQVASVRQARLAKRKQLAVLSPAQAAARKQHKHELQRQSKKRKIQLIKTPKGRAQLGIGGASGATAGAAASAGSKKPRLR